MIVIFNTCALIPIFALIIYFVSSFPSRLRFPGSQRCHRDLYGSNKPHFH